MATPTPNHRRQEKGSTIAFHSIGTVSGFLMITCVLASRKFRSHIDSHKQMSQQKKTFTKFGWVIGLSEEVGCQSFSSEDFVLVYSHSSLSVTTQN